MKKHMKENTNKPKCYRTNNDPYPLCLGAKHPVDFAENDCRTCCLYEDMDEEVVL